MSVMFDVFLGKNPHSLFTKKLDERIFFLQISFRNNMNLSRL